MLRSVLRSSVRFRPHESGRSFVSTVLLTRKWENETVNGLRTEAKKRGLPTKGNKATLITRLHHDDEQKALGPGPLTTSPQQVRHASTAEPTAEVPGIPSSDSAPALPKMLLSMEMPDLSQPEPESETPIPLLPDLWDSERIKAESAPPAHFEPETPKVIAVAGNATHPAGGPSHNLYTEPTPEVQQTEPKKKLSGFWADVADDLGVPTTLPFSGPNAHTLYDVAETTHTSGPQVNYKRTLDQDEMRGVWALLGLLAGSWVVAGYFSTSSVYVEQAQELKEAEKATGKH